MRGNNTLILNAATMVEAVQEYLDRRSTNLGAVRVTQVHAHSDGFRVQLAEPEDEETEEE